MAQSTPRKLTQPASNTHTHCIPNAIYGVPYDILSDTSYAMWWEYLDSHRNTWAAIGVPGNLEAGQAHLGSYRNTWAAIGIPGQL